MEDDQNCSVLCLVRQLNTLIGTHYSYEELLNLHIGYSFLWFLKA